MSEHKKKSKKKLIILLIILGVLIVGGVVAFKACSAPKPADVGGQTLTAAVERRNIISQITGKGTLQPAAAYTVTTLVKGKVQGGNFEEGDIVEEGTILYQLDSGNETANVEKAQLAVKQSKRDYDKAVKNLDNLKIKAEESGTVLSLDVKVGDQVTAGQTVATLRQMSIMSLKIPFADFLVDNFVVGQKVDVLLLDGSYEKLSGTIAKLGVETEVLTGNVVVRYVTVDVPNKGGLGVEQTATATINGQESYAAGTFTYKTDKKITAKVEGEVKELNVKAGDQVSSNQVLMLLTSDSLTDSVQASSDALKNAQLSLEAQDEQLDNYRITSPIKGSIIEKNVKQGDSVEAGKAMCTIYDLSYLTMVMNVDEENISKIKQGQTVAVTATALENKIYNGVVTRINLKGTTTNGVTVYPVTVQIDQAEGLYPGMNVDAELAVAEQLNVLAVPNGAVVRGNRVLAKISSADVADNTGTSDNAGTSDNTGTTTGSSTSMSVADGGNQSSDGAGMAPGADANGQVNLDEFVYVDVVVGISDGEYVEIISGLKEGDIVVYTPQISDEMNNMSMGGVSMSMEMAG